MFPYVVYRWKNAQVPPGTVAILHRVFPLPCPAVTRVPVGKPHRIGPFPVLQFTQVWLFWLICNFTQVAFRTGKWWWNAQAAIG